MWQLASLQPHRHLLGIQHTGRVLLHSITRLLTHYPSQVIAHVAASPQRCNSALRQRTFNAPAVPCLALSCCVLTAAPCAADEEEAGPGASGRTGAAADSDGGGTDQPKERKRKAVRFEQYDDQAFEELMRMQEVRVCASFRYCPDCSRVQLIQANCVGCADLNQLNTDARACFVSAPQQR
jgi:hypothetical protein